MVAETIETLSARYLNLADAGRNARALYASDDFFAPKERMLAATEPEWQEGVYDEHGKWMDGWETRRKRCHGHDFCVVRLLGTGLIRAVDIDTRYFTGNYPPLASVDACRRDSDPDAHTRWTEILPQQVILGNSHNIFPLAGDAVFNHVRLNIFPDGGVARFRVFGEQA